MKKFIARVLTIALFGAALLPQVPARAAGGVWEQNGSNWKYKQENGSYVSNGFQTIDGRKYHFDANGVMDTGWIKSGTRTARDGRVYDNWYYAEASGALVAGWKKIDGTWYYFYLSGRMAADAVVDNGKYYVNSDGVWIGDAGVWKKDSKGWWYQSQDSDRFMNKTTGTYVNYPSNDVCYIDGAYYGFDAAGYMVTGWHDFGWTKNGEHIAAWYYFLGDGKAADGWKLIGGTWYYFEDGYMLSDTVVDGYYLDKSGAYREELSDAYQTKGTWKRYGTRWCYQLANGNFVRNGRNQIDGTWYCFDAEGYMRTGWVQEGNSWFYFMSDGSAATGWVLIGGTWYYFDRTGYMYSDTVVDGYYLNSDGAWVPGGPTYAMEI